MVKKEPTYDTSDTTLNWTPNGILPFDLQDFLLLLILGPKYLHLSNPIYQIFAPFFIHVEYFLSPIQGRLYTAITMSLVFTREINTQYLIHARSVCTQYLANISLECTWDHANRGGDEGQKDLNDTQGCATYQFHQITLTL